MKLEQIITIIIFVVLVLGFYLIKSWKVAAYLKRKKKKKELNIVEIKYLNYRFNIKKERLLTSGFIFLIGLINALIITIVFAVIILLPWPTVLQLLVGFVLLLGLIYAIYEILGRILVKKGYQE